MERWTMGSVARYAGYAGLLAASIMAFWIVSGDGPRVSAADAAQGNMPEGVHLDRSVIPQGCSACHRGHGLRATTMLNRPMDDLCFDCHGSGSQGRLGGGRFDLFTEFQKPSNHPVVDTARYHVQGENLPERNPNTPRHVSCFDCHNIHEATADAPMKGSRGYSFSRREQPRASQDYEVCYLCHGDSANLGPDQRNVMEEFAAVNPSIHPVDSIGRGRQVPSLVRNLSGNTTISCLDCHGSDDSLGPQGPHGSLYPPLLRYRYALEDGPEGPGSYELCYTCHDRRSILADESFRGHEYHVVLQRTSCFTCHASHGSKENADLIQFNEVVVSPSLRSGGPMYLDSPLGTPRCYLSCHDADHSADGINGNPWPAGW